MPNQSDDFADIIAKAQKVTLGDVGSPFTLADNAGRNAFVQNPRQVRGMPEHDYDAHIEIFDLPDDAPGYEAVMNQCLRGEALPRYEERVFTKEGTFKVAMCYLTPRERPAAIVDVEAGDAEPVVRPQRLP